MKLKFFGAARSVTGSCHMVECETGKILVDCGMRQGADAKGAYGESDFLFDPAQIDVLLLTHAHIDHAGLIPLLVKRGFSGKIYTTEATKRLSGVMLPDSAHIQEQEALYTNKKNLRAGKALVEPLYTVADASKALELFCGVAYGEVTDILPGVKARFYDVGHLLGSAAIELTVKEGDCERCVVFSGDIGRPDRPIIRDPETVKRADYLIMEGTYGNREHGASTDDEKEAELEAALRDALACGGNILFPAFAVGRTQELIYYIKRMILRNAVPGLEKIPVYVDSPLAIEATRVYASCTKGYYDAEAREVARDSSPFAFKNLRISQTAEESKAINTLEDRHIIISSSGMCDAGRIRHHLKHNLYRSDATVIFMGYQAEGTLGRALLNGARRVKLFGEEIQVNAHAVQIDGFSGHAGQKELLDWVNAIPEKPRAIFAVHGEERTLETLADLLAAQGHNVVVPHLGDTFTVTDDGIVDACTIALPQKETADALTAQLQRLAALVAQIETRDDKTADPMIENLQAELRTLCDKWQDILRK